MNVAAILRQKGRAVTTAPPSITLLEVARRLAHKRIGAIVVVDAEGQLVGIISERDIIRALSEAGPDEAWEGRKGLVHEAVLEDVADFSPYQVYACGAPGMIDAARDDFCAHGLPADDFFADAFTFAR